MGDRFFGGRIKKAPGLVSLLMVVTAAWGCQNHLAGPGPSGENPDPDPDPSIQPRDLVFSSDRDGDFDLYAMNLDGTDVVQLTNAPGSDLRPRWSPDGNRIAFDSDRDGASAVYVMSADGTEVMRLHAGSLPAWSPDGLSLAFSDAAAAEVSVMAADGTAVRSIASAGNVDGIDWEPNGGDRIAFSYPDPVFTGFEVKTEVVSSDGSDREPFLAFTHLPSWSPDGMRIAGHRSSSLAQLDGIAVISLTTGQTVPIAERVSRRRPGWSPDGGQLLYSDVVLTDGIGNEEIFGASAFGGSLPTQLTVHIANDRDPDWRR